MKKQVVAPISSRVAASPAPVAAPDAVEKIEAQVGASPEPSANAEAEEVRVEAREDGAEFIGRVAFDRSFSPRARVAVSPASPCLAVDRAKV